MAGHVGIHKPSRACLLFMGPLARYRPIIDDFEAFEAACSRPLATTVRVHRQSPSTVRRAFAEAGIAAEPLAWDGSILVVDTDHPGRTLPAYLGWVDPQEAASCLPVPLLDIEPGDTVWDACAAPGSKTGHIADRLDDQGRIFATDDSLGRLSALRFNTERLGITSVAVDHIDARTVSPPTIGVDRFDASLVDAPCSGEGTIRKQPDVVSSWSIDHVKSLAGIQRGILQRAIEATAPGKSVVYSTCTFAPEENEAVIDAVRASHDCAIEPISLPIETRPGLDAWNGTTFHESVRHARRVYPHLSDTGGFFIAKLRVGA